MTGSGSSKPQRRTAARALAHAAVIVVIGAGVGVVDAFARPVKLTRATKDIELPIQPTHGTEAGTQAIADEPKPGPEAEPTKAPVAASDVPPAPPDTSTPPQANGFKPTPKSELPPGQITVAEAKQVFDSGQAGFIDTRAKDKFEEGHIPGAVRLDLESFAEGVPVKLGLFPDRNQTLILYCAGGHCDESERVAERLDGFGYTTVFIIHDGFPGWQAMGYEVEIGPEPYE